MAATGNAPAATFITLATFDARKIHRARELGVSKLADCQNDRPVAKIKDAARQNNDSHEKLFQPMNAAFFGCQISHLGEHWE
jgi:hypothetical protein